VSSLARSRAPLHLAPKNFPPARTVLSDGALPFYCGRAKTSLATSLPSATPMACPAFGLDMRWAGPVCCMGRHPYGEVR